jgi:endonuclease/exonuclease/phosphatase family metal-dependent hydrolase
VLDCRLDASAARQAQVRQLAEFVTERTRRHPTVVVGDFNAGPVRCERLGVVAAGQPQLSDHYGVLAALRY